MTNPVTVTTITHGPGTAAAGSANSLGNCQVDTFGVTTSGAKSKDQQQRVDKIFFLNYHFRSSNHLWNKYRCAQIPTIWIVQIIYIYIYIYIKLRIRGGIHFLDLQQVLYHPTICNMLPKFGQTNLASGRTNSLQIYKNFCKIFKIVEKSRANVRKFC